jgi:hypothetical protein
VTMNNSCFDPPHTVATLPAPAPALSRKNSPSPPFARLLEKPKRKYPSRQDLLFSAPNASPEALATAPVPHATREQQEHQVRTRSYPREEKDRDRERAREMEESQESEAEADSDSELASDGELQQLSDEDSFYVPEEEEEEEERESERLFDQLDHRPLRGARHSPSSRGQQQLQEEERRRWKSSDRPPHLTEKGTESEDEDEEYSAVDVEEDLPRPSPSSLSSTRHVPLEPKRSSFDPERLLHSLHQRPQQQQQQRRFPEPTPSSSGPPKRGSVKQPPSWNSDSSPQESSLLDNNSSSSLEPTSLSSKQRSHSLTVPSRSDNRERDRDKDKERHRGEENDSTQLPQQPTPLFGTQATIRGRTGTARPGEGRGGGRERGRSKSPHRSRSPHNPSLASPHSSSGSGSRKEIVRELSARADSVDPLEVAIEVFDSATTLANDGNLDDAIPLYLHVR